LTACAHKCVYAHTSAQESKAGVLKIIIIMYHCEGLIKKVKHTLRKAAAVQDPPAEVPLSMLTRSEEAEAAIVQQHF
jgi:hypothetical protein